MGQAGAGALSVVDSDDLSREMGPQGRGRGPRTVPCVFLTALRLAKAVLICLGRGLRQEMQIAGYWCFPILECTESYSFRALNRPSLSKRVKTKYRVRARPGNAKGE